MAQPGDRDSETTTGAPAGVPSAPIRARKRSLRSKVRRALTGPAGRQRSKRFKRISKRVVLITLVLGFLLAIDGAYAAWNLKRTLEAAADHLRIGSEAARSSEFETAEREFADALGESESAVLSSLHPGALVSQFMPVVGSDARTVRRLARVAELTSKAGVSATVAARKMGATDTGLAGSVLSGGQVDFQAIKAGHPYLEEIDALMADAAELVIDSPTPRFGPVITALNEARERIPSASSAAHKANVLFESLPTLFAEGGSRRYLLIFQAPSDQRGGGGGIIGLYGILEASDGHIQLTHLGSPYDEGLSPTRLPRSEVPDWYARSYSWAAALTDWQSVNISPHFPVVSETLLKMYEQETGDSLDGVLSLDPVAFAELTKATGPLEGSGMDVVVTPENAVDVLARDVYTNFSDDNLSQNEFLKSIMENFWGKFSSGAVEPVAIAEAFAEAARTQHFRMYVRDDKGLSALTRLGVTGDYTDQGPNVQMVFNENVAGNKVDYFLHRSVDTQVRLKPDGSAEVKTTVSLQNKAPKGPPSLLLGPGFKTDPVGLNAMYINVLMPSGARIDTFSINGKQRRGLRLKEEDRPIVSEIILVKAGETGVAETTYEVPDAAEIVDGKGSFRMTLWPQATINPDRFTLSVLPPYGYEFADSEGVGANGASFKETGMLDEPTSVSLQLEAR